MKIVYLEFLLCITIIKADYWSDRENFIQDERKSALGINIQLNQNETNVNKIIKKMKKKEMELGMNNPALFPPALHFFESKKLIENSKLFSIIKQMPKGCVLHTHDLATVSANWIVKNVTYRDNLYICIKHEDWTFKFADSKPTEKCWQLLSDVRINLSKEQLEQFDAHLNSLLTLERNITSSPYQNTNDIWNKFFHVLKIRTSLLTYRPIYEDFIYETHTNFYNDNITYFEIRSDLVNLYELNGTLIKQRDIVGIIDRVSKTFKQNHPDFYGMRLIYSGNRKDSNETMAKKLKVYQEIKELYPDLVIGFDISAQEDLGRPTMDFVAEILKNEPINLFLHVGETNWNGMFSDNDLIDAILLNSSRIGHGFALLQHPKVLEEIKKRNIAVEVNPISNQVLMLVKDLRNHPARYLISNGYPIVISSDDFGFLGSSAQNYDFYLTFMGIAHAKDDLRLLKQLALNSIEYTALNEKEKETLRNIWLQKWSYFINSISAEM